MTGNSNSPPVEDPDDDGPRYSGRWAIIAVTLLAVLMASYAWWHRRQAGERALEFWGPETALLISRAPEVELIELGLDNRGLTAVDEAPRFGSSSLAAVRTKLVQRGESVPGLNKARTILLQDNAFAWDEPAGSCEPRWQYALEFRDGQRRATVLIALDCPRVKLVEREASASIRPIAEPLREFLVAQFPEAQFPTPGLPHEKLTTPAAK
ncbi:MAG: hypothetical protein K2Y37_14270 [Pirellulales bacterium]|nr:hypothetical protein [Pirellulales bacterium]